MRNSSLKRSDMARVDEGSHSIPATHTFIHESNEPYLPLLRELREDQGAESSLVIPRLSSQVSRALQSAF